MFTITECEWDTAEYYLCNKRNGTKLTYSAKKNALDALVPRSSQNRTKVRQFDAIEKDRQINPKLSQTLHSFIKIEGAIYGVAQGKECDALIGCGQFGKVKYIQDRAGNRYVLKLEWGENRNQRRESIILKDRQLSVGKHKILHLSNSQDASTYRLFETKYATHMVYLGKTMEEVIVEACPDEKRVKMAIQLCLAVHDLHKVRSKSLTKTAYAHRDIKPSNVTWDETKGEAHLVDFGFSHPYPKKVSKHDMGTTAYLPKHSRRDLTGEQYDILALRRTLYLQESGYCSSGYYDNYRQEDPALCPGILTLKLLKQLDVERFINTSSTRAENNYFTNDNLSAAALAAILIAAQLKLTYSFDALKNDRCKSLVVIALYGNSREYIEQVLKDKRQSLIIGAFSEMGKFSEMDSFMKDKAFVLQIEHAVCLEEVCVLIHLKDLDLGAFYQTIYEPDITSALYSMIQQSLTLSNKKHTQYIMERPSLAKAINVLERAKLQEHFLPLFSSPQLCDACAKINNQDILTMRKLADLFRKKLDCETIVNQLVSFEKDKKNGLLPSISIFAAPSQRQDLVANATSVKMLK